MWDSEWEEDIDEYNYRHQRRLSDPSANLNYFSNKYAWRAKGKKAFHEIPSSPLPKTRLTEKDTTTYGQSKARSEQEGLDCLASEVSEIESGDLRDGKHRVTFAWLFIYNLNVLVNFNFIIFFYHTLELDSYKTAFSYNHIRANLFILFSSKLVTKNDQLETYQRFSFVSL